MDTEAKRSETKASEFDLLKKIESDLSFLKQKVVIIEEEVDAISNDMHELRPEYARKLQELEKGKFLSFKSVDELKKSIESPD